MRIGHLIRKYHLSLNRNILECKYISDLVANDWVTVLIETYWNVNTETDYFKALVKES